MDSSGIGSPALKEAFSSSHRAMHQVLPRCNGTDLAAPAASPRCNVPDLAAPSASPRCNGLDLAAPAASPRCNGPDLAAPAASPSQSIRFQVSEHALMAQLRSQLQQIREEFRTECQGQVGRVEEALREELQTCRKEVLDAVKAEAAERLESAARMEKDRHSALKEEATVRRAVATHLETRLTKVAASIETV